MQSKFDEIIDRRNTGSWKWDEFSREVLPMWLADMDFRAPACVRESLKQSVEQGVFGYSIPTEKLQKLIVDRLAKQHHLFIDKEDIVWLPGLVTGINLACKCAGEECDEILVPTPAYPPFLMAPSNQKRKCTKVPMMRKGNRWLIDFELLKSKITPKTKGILLCNPHNPTGRVFTRDELLQIGEIAIEHDLVICSDEIHCDLVLAKQADHVSIASLGEEISKRTISLFAPSKTFNIAGLGFSFAVVKNPELKAKFSPQNDGLVPHINQLGFVAGEAAYQGGEPWRLELIEYLRGNLELVQQMVDSLDGVSMIAPEATYLAWIDCSALGLRDPSKYFLEQGLGLGFGSFFGDRNFVRMNFACPRETLLQGLRLFKTAVKNLSKV